MSWTSQSTECNLYVHVAAAIAPSVLLMSHAQRKLHLCILLLQPSQHAQLTHEQEINTERKSCSKIGLTQHCQHRSQTQPVQGDGGGAVLHLLQARGAAVRRVRRGVLRPPRQVPPPPGHRPLLPLLRGAGGGRGPRAARRRGPRARGRDLPRGGDGGGAQQEGAARSAGLSYPSLSLLYTFLRPSPQV